MKYGLNDKTITVIQETLAKYPQIDQAILYGSRAKGNFRRGSDIDLTLKGEGLTLKILYALENEIDDLLLPYFFDISIFEQIENQDLVEHIQGIGKVFYQRKTIMDLQNQAYRNWLKNLKYQVRSLQQNAVRSVNRELIRFYWQLGEGIVQKQKNTKWGDGFLKQLSQDLSKEFPDIKGFSKRNLELVRKWYLFWQPMSIAKQPVSQLQTADKQQIIQEITNIPWGHNLVIVSKC